MKTNKPQIGIIGAGTMGRGIAQVAATAGHPVVLFDANYAALRKAENDLNALMDKLVQKGKITQSNARSILDNIHYSEENTKLHDSSVIIEAIVEDLRIKKEVFSTLEEKIADDCILATNTSSLSITSIASACKRSQRVVGMHFFNPPGLMQLVEVTPAVQTSDNTVREVIELSESWGKIAVRAKDTPGFIVNRIARPFYSEALRIFEEGHADIPTIDWAMKEIGGFRMGPFELMDYIGNDVNYAVTETVWKQCYYEPRYKPSFTQKRIVEAGYLGRKTGRGYYDYSDVANIPEATKNSSQAEMIVSRIVTMLINEAADAVNWRIASVEDIDLAMTRGANYPKGLLRWADERGIEKVVEAMDALFDHYHEERYRCCPLLRSMAQIGAAFYDD